jgi:colanic acid/amylovoran biosynthesis glycosyltransferase
LLAAGADPANVVVHHMGVDMAQHAARPLPERGSPGSLRLAIVGRLVEKKAQTLAVAAIGELRARRPDLAITLDIVGDGPLAEAVDKAIADHALGDRIIRHGARSHAESLAIVAAADAFLLPSLTAVNGDMEGIPVALMEAMAMGCPVISTFHSGIPELVTDQESGLLAPEGDVAGIAAAIERMADDPALRVRLALAGREAVARSFDALSLGKQLRRRYRGLVQATEPECG